MNQLVTEANLTRQHPELGTGPVSADIYYKPEIHEKEYEAIFRRSWFLVGRVEELAEPGSFFVRDLPTFRYSILICRDKDGGINGFHNVCQHRGSVVQHRSSGKCAVFTCRFHGWSYDLKGNLIRVRDEEGFPGLDKTKLSLRRIPTAIWQGFIFVHPEDEPDQSLEEYLGQQGADLSGYPFEAGSERYEYEAEIHCNWKLLVDSFSESYHVGVLHNRSLGPTMLMPDNPAGRVLDVYTNGPHRTISYWSSLTETPHPVQRLAYENQPGPSIVSAKKADFEFPRGLNRSRSNNWSVDVQIFFPNVLFVVTSGMYVLHQVWPLAANRCHYVKRGFLRKAENAAQRFGQENSLVEFRDLVLEDINTLERIQRALDSGRIKEFHYHDHEVALRHQHHVVCDYIRRYESAQGQA